MTEGELRAAIAALQHLEAILKVSRSSLAEAKAAYVHARTEIGQQKSRPVRRLDDNGDI